MEDHENKLTFRQFSEKIINSKYGRALELFSTLLSAISCIVFIVSTYLDSDIIWFDEIDYSIIIIYIFEYFLK